MTNSHASDAYQRFLASMVMDVGKWRDGIGYDLIALAELTESDRLRLAEQLARQSPLDWRDIEALAAIDRLGSQSGSHPLTQRTAEPEKSAQSGVKQSPSNVASECLRKALRNGDANCVLAISRFAPEIVSESSKIDALVSALQLAKFYEGLTEAIDEAAELHPPEVVKALFEGTLNREGEVAVHFAALLFYIFGKAEEPFDWAHRPFFLTFNTELATERLAAFRELCKHLEVDANTVGVSSAT